MTNICITLAYDGTKYCGWQVQTNGITIQEVIEKAIQRLTGEKCAVYSAGRTDSGVHALGQVANFKTTSVIPEQNWQSALQAYLPNDIVIRDARAVPDAFHSTFSAIKKRYRYVIYDGQALLPFLRNYTYTIRKKLDERQMHAAAQRLVGTHDFRSFETDWPNKVTSVRTVLEISFTRQGGWPVWSPTLPEAVLTENVQPKSATEQVVSLSHPQDGDFICMDIVADGFLYNMVRSIVGTLINVGRGRWTADDVTRILDAQDRSIAGNTAPACGLYLVQVDYE